MVVLFLDMVEKKLDLLRIVPGAFPWSIPLQGETIILLLAAIVSC